MSSRSTPDIPQPLGQRVGGQLLCLAKLQEGLALESDCVGQALSNLDDVDLKSSFLDGMLSDRQAAPNRENITASVVAVIPVEGTN